MIDAGATVGALLPTIAPVNALERFVTWRQAGASIVAPPLLLLAECTSVIRRYVFNRLLTADEAAVALTNGARQLDIDWVIWVGEG